MEQRSEFLKPGFGIKFITYITYMTYVVTDSGNHKKLHIQSLYTASNIT